MGFKGIERFAAFSATPEDADGWRGLAKRAMIFGTAWSLFQTEEHAGSQPSMPTVQRDENTHEAEPNEVVPERRIGNIGQEGERKKAGDAEEAQDGCDHQTAGASKDEPKQTLENLSSIQRIDGEKVKDKQGRIYL